MTEYLPIIQAISVLITCVASLVLWISIARYSSSLEARMTRIDNMLNDASREQVVNLINKINDAQKDGHVIDWQNTHSGGN